MTEILDLMILTIEKQNKINEQLLKHIAILDARISVLEAENKEPKNEGIMKHGKNVAR